VREMTVRSRKELRVHKRSLLVSRPITQMNFLKKERGELEELLPGLDAALAGFSLMDMEVPGNPAINDIRRQSPNAALLEHFNPFVAF